MEKKRIYVVDEYKEKFARVLTANYLDNRLPMVETVENGIILPAKKQIDKDGTPYFLGGVADSDGRYIPASQNWRGAKGGSLTGGYEITPGKEKSCAATVVFAGILQNHFGHFLMESTSRLWFWLEHQDMDIAYIMGKKAKIIGRFWEFMALLGIPPERVHIINEPIRFKKVYIPSSSHIFEHSYTEAFIRPYQYAAEKVEPGKNEKIYLSRTKFSKGTVCYGECEIEKVFNANGFKSVYPEKLSLREQIAAIKGAKEIAGVIGTATHLEVFARPGVKSIILERSDMPIAEQAIVHQAIKADWYSVGANMNPFPIDHSDGPVLLGITEEVCDFCRDMGLNVEKGRVGYIAKRHCRKFIKDYMRRNTQLSYNQALALQEPLLARRLLRMAGAFVPWRKKIKQKWKAWRLSGQ